MIGPFYLKEWKLKKLEKLVANFHDKEEYVLLVVFRQLPPRKIVHQLGLGFRLGLVSGLGLGEDFTWGHFSKNRYSHNNKKCIESLNLIKKLG